ncbi:MAG: hypothetical protein V8R85_00015 [Frisingicoccus sp.]
MMGQWRYLNEIDEEEYLFILRDLLAGQEQKSIHAADGPELNGKLMQFAISSGFELKDIKRCMEQSR